MTTPPSPQRLSMVADTARFRLRRSGIGTGEARMQPPNALETAVDHDARLHEALLLAQSHAAAHKKAEAANREMREFLATISHEIRTPINSILGMAELLMKSELPDGQQRHYSQWIVRSASNLSELVDNMLDLSQAESGRLAIEKAPLDLRLVCDEVTELLMPKAVDKKIGLFFRCSHDLPSRLIGDAGRLRQILVNLAANAVKFTETGHVLINVECSDRTDEKATVTIKVVDTGIGIPQDKLPLLFQRYSQVQSSTGSHSGGTGLGLAICKNLVELMGGDIGVESSPGKGSTFWFTIQLPVANHRSQETAAELPSAPALPGAFRVLVVDDDPPSQMVAAAMLQSLGCITDTAVNGAEAVAMARRTAYDFVFMDCSMPGMTGPEATAAIRRGTAGNYPVVIALTAHTLHGHREQCLDAGMDGYVSKPVRYHHLQEVLARWKPFCPFNPDRVEGKQRSDAKRLEEVSFMFRKAGQDFFSVVVEPFLKNVEESVVVLRRAIEQEQLLTLRETVHRLKGGSSSLGIDRIARICMRILEDVQRNGLHNVEELVQSLEVALWDVREQVHALRAKGLI